MNGPIRYGTARRLARWMGLDHNPLRRDSDRVESAVRLAAFAVLLLSLVAGALLGLRWYGSDARTAAEAAATRHQVIATVTADTAAQATAYTSRVPVSARWSYRGVGHTGTIDVAGGTTAGSSEMVWVDDTGSLAVSPLTWYQAAGDAVFGALALPFGAALLLLVVVVPVGAALDRRRAARWESEWALVEPGWTHHFRHR